MKTSFYFVLWILIYPILGLFNNSFIDNNAFIVALVIVVCLLWLLDRKMPATLAYENATQIAPVLEDIYIGNVQSFKKRLTRDANIETVTAVYFLVTTFVIVLAISKGGINNWIALAVFGYFTYGAISRSISLIRAKALLKSNPTPEQCMEIASDTYKLNYASYLDERNCVSYQDMMPPKPKYFKAFKIFSITIAAIAALLGLLYIVASIILMLSRTSLESGAVGGMFFLYGSLAAYFGVKDFVSCIHSKSNISTIRKEPTA